MDNTEPVETAPANTESRIVTMSRAQVQRILELYYRDREVWKRLIDTYESLNDLEEQIRDYEYLRGDDEGRD